MVEAIFEQVNYSSPRLKIAGYK